MEDTREGARPGSPSRPAGQRVLLAVSLLFVLAAVTVATYLVAYTAWGHDLRGGLFALTFAVLGTRTALSWVLWLESDRPGALPAPQRGPELQKPADETSQ